MNTAPSEYLTYEQAAARSGLKHNTLRNYVVQGILPRVPGTGGRGQNHNPPLFTAEAVDAISGRQAAYQASRAERREAILSAGERQCTGPCGRTLPLDTFELHPRGIGGRHSRCPDCQRAKSRQYSRDHRDEKLAYKAVYRKANQDKIRAYRRAYGKRLNQEKGPVYQNLRRYFSDRYYLLRAIEDGKTSPVCKRVGFALLRQSDGSYRAARLDKPFAHGEQQLAHYQWGVGGTQKWIVLAPQYADNKTRAFAARLARREKRGS